MPQPYVSIVLMGPPRGKGRHRSRLIKPRGKPAFISNYADPETVKFEQRIAAVAAIAMTGKAILDEPLSVAVDAFLPIPASWSKRDREMALSGDLWPTGKPDIDNFMKCWDALNGVVWRDDSSIVRAVGTKRYSAEPRLVFSVYRWIE